METTYNPTSIEKALYQRIRRLASRGRLAVVGVSLGFLGVGVALPWIWVGATSFNETERICRAHAIELRGDYPRLPAVTSGVESPPWTLRHSHICNSFGMAVSTIHLFIWLYYCSHRFGHDKGLDLKRELDPPLAFCPSIHVLFSLIPEHAYVHQPAFPHPAQLEASMP